MVTCIFYTRADSQRTDKLERIFNHLQFLDTLKFTIYKQFHLPCRTIWRESVAAVRTRATGRSRASAADRSTCRAAWTRTSTGPVSTDQGSHLGYSAAKYPVSVRIEPFFNARLRIKQKIIPWEVQTSGTSLSSPLDPPMQTILPGTL